jgi:hypothetical protein
VPELTRIVAGADDGDPGIGLVQQIENRQFHGDRATAWALPQESG